MAGTTPLAPTYNQAPPQGQASTVAASQLPPWLMAALSPNQTIGQIYTAFQPQANQAEMNLSDTLAEYGISGGEGVAQQDALQSSLAEGLAPELGNAIMGAQGNVLNANEFNANQGQNAAEFNAGATNNMTDFNLQNAIATATGNTGIANNFLQSLLGYQNSNYGQGLSGYTGLTETGLGGANNLAGINATQYPVQSGAGNSFGTLAQSLGYLYGNPQGSQYANAQTQTPQTPYGSDQTQQQGQYQDTGPYAAAGSS